MGIDAQLEGEIADVATAVGCELLHAEFVGGTLRLVLDRPDGGVTLRDCELVSKQVSALLDVSDFGGERRYTLEVSSPGLDRQLYRPADYQRFTGRLARVTYVAPETGRKRTLVGRLESFDPADGGRVELVPAEGGDRVMIPLPRISVARLEIEG